MTVTYCKNSTLREVFAALIGLPSPVARNEFDSLRTRFEREWPESQFSSLQLLLPQSPSLNVVPQADVPPFWFGQLSWDGGKWIGRWGHHTVGLHRVVLEGEQYRTFSRTMTPTLDRWLVAAREAYTFAGMDPIVASVVFGYVNAFTMGLDTEDLSEWFRFNFAIEASGATSGLSELAVGARIPRPEERARVTISLSARKDIENTRISVHTVAERDVPDGTTFSQAGILQSEIQHAKVLAKEAFFSFATDRMLNYMGATDADESEA